MSAGNAAPGYVSALGFWVGALLPFAYLPAFLTGVDSITRLVLFLGLLAVNAVALVLGRDYPGGGKARPR